MEDHEVIILVYVDFGSLYAAAAVFYVKGVKIEILAQEVEVLFRRIQNVIPFDGS